MKGKKSEVQKKILDMNPCAFFMPCGVHSLNFIVNVAALCNKEILMFFGIIQEIYNFFKASTHRWLVLQKHVANLTVKPLSQTKWENRIKAVLSFRYQLSKIYLFFESSENERLDAYARKHHWKFGKTVKKIIYLCAVKLYCI